MTGFVSCSRGHDHWTSVVKLISEVVESATKIECQLFLFDQSLVPTRALAALKNLDQQRHCWKVRRVLRWQMIAGGERRQVCELVSLRNSFLFRLRRLSKI